MISPNKWSNNHELKKLSILLHNQGSRNNDCNQLVLTSRGITKREQFFQKLNNHTARRTVELLKSSHKEVETTTLLTKARTYLKKQTQNRKAVMTPQTMEWSESASRTPTYQTRSRPSLSRNDQMGGISQIKHYGSVRDLNRYKIKISGFEPSEFKPGNFTRKNSLAPESEGSHHLPKLVRNGANIKSRRNNNPCSRGYFSEKIKSPKSVQNVNKPVEKQFVQRVRSVSDCNLHHSKRGLFLPELKRRVQRSQPSLLSRVKERYFEMNQAQGAFRKKDLYLTPHSVQKYYSREQCELVIGKSSPPRIERAKMGGVKNQNFRDLTSKSVPKIGRLYTLPIKRIEGLKFVEPTKLSTIESSMRLCGSPDSSLTRILWHNRALGTGKKLGMHSQDNTIQQLKKHAGDMAGPPQELQTLGDLEISNIDEGNESLQKDQYYQYCMAHPSEDTRELQEFLKVML